MAKRNRRRKGQRRKQSDSQGRQRFVIFGGVATIALVAVVIAAVFLVNRSEDADHQAAGLQAPLAISSENAETGIAVGNLIPDFDIRLNNGNIVSASNQVEDGKPTFYFFFATW